MTSVHITSFPETFASDFTDILSKYIINKFNPDINKPQIGYTSNLFINKDTTLENLRTINCSCDFQPQDSQDKYTINIELFYHNSKLFRSKL